MTLENLVPPLDLCKKIPAGAFADSVLVWSRRPSHFAPHEWVIPRGYAAEVRDIAPAPTLQEIFFSIEKDHRCYLPNVYCTPELALKLWLDQENRIKAKGETEA